MEKRAILAIALSMVVLFGYQYFYTKMKPPVPAVKSNAPEVKVNPLDKPEKQPEKTEISETKVSEISRTTPGKREDIAIETENYIAVINLVSGNVVGWELKKYCVDKEIKKETNGKQENKKIKTSVKFLREESNIESFSILGFDESNLSYAPSSKEAVFDKNGKFDLELTAIDKNKIKIKKIYSFSKNDPMVNLKVIFENSGKNDISLRAPGVRLAAESAVFQSKQNVKYFHKILSDGKVIKTENNNFEKNSGHSGNIRWSAFTGLCYAACIISPEVFAVHSSVKQEGEFAYTTLALQDASIKPSEEVSLEFWIYMGATPYDTLTKYKVDLDKLLDFGWFSGIGIWLLVILNFFYRLVGNYGVSIILLTILIKVILWIPSKKSFVSMKKMQKLQPQMAALKSRFKNNPQQLNQEMLKLYKDNKVNPMGGCLPMLLQLPIFYALYMVLANAAELQGAPFMLWIVDLSKMDKYYILPILMGGTMFVQQKMTPTTGDPAQAKIFMFLPIILTFLFAGLPAGLLLYWVIQNILQIIQQYFINKSIN